LKFTDFDSDALTVAQAAVIGMIALFGGQEVRHRFTVINAKVPHDPAGAAESRIIAASLAFCREVTSILCRSRTNVLCRMNRYVARSHRPGDKATMNIWRQ
jgi:hypothetical protein